LNGGGVRKAKREVGNFRQYIFAFNTLSRHHYTLQTKYTDYFCYCFMGNVQCSQVKYPLGDVKTYSHKYSILFVFLPLSLPRPLLLLLLFMSLENNFRLITYEPEYIVEKEESAMHFALCIFLKYSQGVIWYSLMRLTVHSEI